MTTTAFITVVAVAVVAFLVLRAALRLARGILRLAIHVAVIAAIGALLGGAGATYAHLRAIEGQVRAAVAQAYGPAGNGRPGSLPVDATAARAITARLTGVVPSLRVVPACRRGARVVTVRYREPGPPLVVCQANSEQ